MFNGYNMMGWFGGGFGMLIFWVVLILFVIWAIRELGGDKKSDNSALEILRQRYAKGEINKEEFEAKRLELMK